MTFLELLTAVQAVVYDQRYTAAIIKARLNESVSRVATGVLLPGRVSLSPPLPDLYTTDTIDTELSVGITDLPTDFNRDVVQIQDSDGNIIPIIRSTKSFLEKYYQLSAGRVYICSPIGNRLMYRDVPAVSEALTVHYYRTPTPMSADTSVPEGIPASLHRKLIIGHTLMEIFREIEMGMSGPKVDTEYYSAVFGSGLLELDEVFPPDGTPGCDATDSSERLG